MDLTAVNKTVQIIRKRETEQGAYLENEVGYAVENAKYYEVKAMQVEKKLATTVRIA